MPIPIISVAAALAEGIPLMVKLLQRRFGKGTGPIKKEALLSWAKDHLKRLDENKGLSDPVPPDNVLGDMLEPIVKVTKAADTELRPGEDTVAMLDSGRLWIVRGVVREVK